MSGHESRARRGRAQLVVGMAAWRSERGFRILHRIDTLHHIMTSDDNGY